ncbi:Srb4p Ecym_7194 [Eremothecium cymbalariae DBVPG|uniref:Mediator of RNA polymerase II transcription subunit 17 n=1 Tax=Eremothecium cymbalariae (strain CBS 270.75 / DBVPG 7215 / KCTC 17166 / NRRL Y-17582) TaxID=931890 RepID=G8JW27_ERECY|nr:hypothetical protein Ecym_7194 [Eremothecium cymbalariae DBVPG\
MADNIYSNNFSSSPTHSDGIPIVLDPNLINLTLPTSSTAASVPATVPTNGPESATEPQPDSAGANSLKQQRTLVNNPYETFGQMPLQQLIPLILQMRGNAKFSDLSEEALVQEIEMEEKGVTVQTEDMDGEIDMGTLEEDQALKPQEITDDGSESRPRTGTENIMSQEQFNQLKRDVLEHINLALNESSLSLEFIVLLLSSVRASVGVNSMSPFLKRSVPPASMNADKIPLQQKSKRDILLTAVINKGWKLRALEEARSLLKDNYLKLEKSLEIEQAHWAIISQHISNSDVIFKMRDRNMGKRSLAIKYGYEDSGSLYKQDRGVAILRHNTEQNKLELVPVSNSKEQVHITKNSVERFMRVHVYTKIEEDDDYILSGESSIDDQSLTQCNLDDIGRQIARLKFFIFERELMYQLKKESAQLISYGVNLENENKIVFESPGEKIEIEMVLLDDNALLSTQDAPRKDDKRANLILILLRMLLVVMHKKQLRYELKPTLTKQKPRGYDKDLILLRPIVGKIRHQNYLKLIEKVVTETVLNKIPNSTINFIPTAEEKDTHTYKELYAAELDKQIALFDKMLTIPKTEMKINLLKKGTINLILKSINYCNAVIQVKYTNFSGEVIFDARFTEYKELEEFLNFIVSEYVT